MLIRHNKILSNIIRFSKNWIVYCLLFTITAQSLSTGVVLCFENDGRMEVESGSDGKCCQTFNKIFQKSFTFISNEQDSDNSCGICVDVPLYITAEKKHSSEPTSLKLKQFISTLYASSLSYAALIEKSCPKTSFSLLIFRNISPITSLQSVILQV